MHSLLEGGISISRSLAFLYPSFATIAEMRTVTKQIRSHILAASPATAANCQKEPHYITSAFLNWEGDPIGRVCPEVERSCLVSEIALAERSEADFRATAPFALFSSVLSFPASDTGHCRIHISHQPQLQLRSPPRASELLSRLCLLLVVVLVGTSLFLRAFRLSHPDLFATHFSPSDTKSLIVIVTVSRQTHRKWCRPLQCLRNPL